ncbi:MAG: sterol desaturase family protein [Bdellovibrionia bacterium]
MDYLAIVQFSTFIIFGVFAWYLSYLFPMVEYRTEPVHSFDRWYFIIAIALIGVHSSYVAPWAGSQILALWPRLADSILSIQAWASQQSVALRWLEFVLVADFLGYFAHRFMHSCLAWRFHSLHHSTTSVNWLSGVRGTPIHYVVIVSPTLLANHLFMNGLGFWPAFGFIVFDILNQQFCHSNVRIKFAKQLEYLLVTPRMHFVHHHPIAQYTDSNYGLYFSIWDRLFGTYVDADSVEPKGLLGLDYHETEWSGFFGLNRRTYPHREKERT